MDEISEIDGGGPDQVPAIDDSSEFGQEPVGSPIVVPEPSEFAYVDRASDEDPPDDDENFGTSALDLSGSNAHRISPEPEASAGYVPTENRPAKIPPVRHFSRFSTNLLTT
jgi:hypothetical protein